MGSAFHWILILSLIFVTSSRQESWKLVDGNNKNFEGMVAFKNVTAPAKLQSLAWQWAVSNSESWENKINLRYKNDVTEGALTYRNESDRVKTRVHIRWKLAGEDFNSVYSKKKIFNNFWKISTIEGLNMAFSSDQFGNWEFKVLDKYIITNKEKCLKCHDEDPAPISRRRRSEDPEFSDNPGTNITIQEAGVMECVYDFLFGEGDPMTGQGEGVFTKVKNWVKDIACRIRGNCEGEVPSSIIPTATMPPYNPDAEEVPSNPDNDVK